MSTVVQNKRTSESKYVSIFNDGGDGTPDVDISFREPLLSRPSDHFLVGVDNLTVNLNNLSMIEMNDAQDPNDFVFQVARLSGRPDVAQATLDAEEQKEEAAPGTANAAAVNETSYIFPEEYKFRVQHPVQNIQQLAFMLNSHFEYVNDTFEREGVEEAFALGGRGAVVNQANRKIQPDLTGAHPDLGADDKPGKHVRCDLTGDGRLRIRGSRLFWSTHFIRFTDPKFMYMFNGRRRQTRTTDAVTGEHTYYDESQYAYNVDGTSLFGRAVVDTHRIVSRFSANGRFCTLRAMPVSFATTGANQARLAATGAGAGGSAANQTYRNSITTIIFGANLLSTADRRIAVELGCSLPIVNNPLVDHGVESPDITLGRWMFNPMVRIKTTVRGQNMEFESSAPDVFELQNATDRVQYLSLMPQDKIHMLRVKMYARVRRYDPEQDRFDMETVVYPMKKADWWHARLHFVSKY